MLLLIISGPSALAGLSSGLSSGFQRESRIDSSNPTHICVLKLPAWETGQRGEEIGILLPNNQGQHSTLHIQKNVLPNALC